MRVVFISNYFNHHQRYLSDELFRLCDGNFTFIETEQMEEDRLALGWGERITPSYVHSYNSSIEEKKYCRRVIKDSEVIIAGSCSEKYILESHFYRKLIFRYYERPFKKAGLKLEYLCKLVSLELIKNLTVSKTYMLCASAYSASDYSKIGFYKNKTYKWGYFPETVIHNVDALLQEKNKSEILWCGRFLDWKHPDVALSIAKRLKEDGFNFKMKFIGTGPMEAELKEKAKEYNLFTNVSFLGAMSPQAVRRSMEKAGVFLFTSDTQEGWGAVLNEAMNSACAVVASVDAGSTPFLVEHMVNGLRYGENSNDLYEEVKSLLNDYSLQERLGILAYKSIVSLWNAQTAARCLVELIRKIQDGEKYPYIVETGPCSKA